MGRPRVFTLNDGDFVQPTVLIDADGNRIDLETGASASALLPVLEDIASSLQSIAGSLGAGSGGAFGGVVDHYSDLPSAGSHDGEFWFVRHDESSHPAAIYISQSGIWSIAVYLFNTP
jgi:hypothetical protein